MGKEERRKMKRKGPEGGRKREAWKKVGLGEDARLLGRLGVQLGGERRNQEKEMAPKEDDGSAPPWLSSDQLQKLFPKALRTWDKRKP